MPLQEDQVDKMQNLCYNLAHQIGHMSRDDIQFIQYHIHAYYDYMRNYIPTPHKEEE